METTGAGRTGGTTTDPVRHEPADDDAVLDLLRGWVRGRRWFPAKGADGALEQVAVARLADPAGEARVEVRVLRVPGGAVVQVPVTLRPADGPAAAPSRDAARSGDGVVGEVDGVVVHDGCHDPAFVRAWLAAATWDRPADRDGATAGDPTAGATVLSGEQSNTSVLLPGARPPAILKVFRTLATGPSPDVDVPLALAHVGWTGVPRPLAWLAGAWPGPGGVAVGHLGVLSELVPGAEDGFRLACTLAADGVPFGERAEALGRTTAQMHEALRRALPVPGGPAPADRVLATLRERAAAATAAAPQLAERAAAVDAVLAQVTEVGPLPALQRVHGDYHLGQVLCSARGWSVLDFEGEPMASAAERTRPDLALRDLAGMLRSLDYAAAVGGAPSAHWAADAREHLVAGYVAEAGPDAAGPGAATLLRALELDKALYEVVYEVRNRPTWVHIPLAGVDRLIGR